MCQWATVNPHSWGNVLARVHFIAYLAVVGKLLYFQFLPNISLRTGSDQCSTLVSGSLGRCGCPERSLAKLRCDLPYYQVVPVVTVVSVPIHVVPAWKILRLTSRLYDSSYVENIKRARGWRKKHQRHVEMKTSIWWELFRMDFTLPLLCTFDQLGL